MTLIVAASATPVAAQTLPASNNPSAQPAPVDERSPTIRERLDTVQNLEVREAFSQLREHWSEVVIVLAIVIVLFLAVSGVLRPGGFSKNGIREVKGYPAAIWLFAGGLVILAQPAAMDFLSSVPAIVGNAEADPAASEIRLTAASYLVATIVAIGMTIVMAVGVGDAGLKVGPLDLLTGVGCLLIAMPLVQVAAIAAAAAYRQFAQADPPAIGHSTLQFIADNRSHELMWMMIVAVVVGAALVEEVVFRVGLQGSLLKMTGSPWLAIIGTSLIFAGLHFSMVPVESRDAAYVPLSQLFVLSLALGVAFERSKRIGVPIVMHMAFNAVTIAAALSLIEPTSTGTTAIGN